MTRPVLVCMRLGARVIVPLIVAVCCVVFFRRFFRIDAHL
ncbi:hypothetical protein L581_0697 [Serratia fonticola AU-AP2C]|nr:hypothetical protein L581_0697 [Serratia fonticola AU-AP2C]